jgi:penicillin amidase
VEISPASLRSAAVTDPDRIDLVLKGLERPAEIVMDLNGIPHIRAETRHDIFFAQGFAAARERLWQLDLWRKRGLGRLAADFGPGFLAQDRAARLFLYRGDMAAEWAYGTEEARAIVSAFAGGHQRLDRPLRGAAGPAGARVRGHGHRSLSTGRPRMWCASAAMGWCATCCRRWPAPGCWPRAICPSISRARPSSRRGRAEVPEGVDWSAIPAGVLDVFKLATVRLDFSHARMTASLEDAWKWTRVDDLGDVYLQGSNNWTIAPSRTATGRPILGSDPHRAALAAVAALAGASDRARAST